ncbi:MAG TPA: FmdB family zinc ribbon protein [Nitrospiria bacterium]
MPIYEYECASCKDRTEVMQKISDAPLTRCESCGGALRKVLSAPGLMFKGSGWYVTDYSDKLKDPKKKDTKEGPAKKTDSSKTKKPETKGDAKTQKPPKKDPSSK